MPPRKVAARPVKINDITEDYIYILQCRNHLNQLMMISIKPTMPEAQSDMDAFTETRKNSSYWVYNGKFVPFIEKKLV